MANRLWNLVSRGSAPAQDDWTEDVEAGGRAADADDIRRVLEACCKAGAEALILSFEDKSVCPARFLETGDEIVRLSVEGDLPSQLQPPTQCSVSLRFGQRNRVFIATVLAIRPGEMSGGALELLLKIPAEIAAGDPRMAFRVPILKPDDLGLALRVDATPVAEARALNLSLIGILIETPQGDVRMSPDSSIEVSLRHGDVQVTLRAELRRRYDRKLALFFPDVLEDGSLDPPVELRTIVRDLELLWLRQRAR